MAADTIDFTLAATAGGAVSKTFSLPLFKLNATAAPGVTDDDAAGYAKGSVWVDVTNKHVYVCTDNTTGAATWAQVDATGGPPTGAAGGDLGGTYPNPTVVKVSGKFAMAGKIAPAALGASVNDWSPAGLSGCSLIRVDVSSAGFSITGLDASWAADGQMMTLLNVNASGRHVIIAHQSASSIATNRFVLPSATGMRLEPNEAMTFRYSTDTSRWEMVSQAPTVDEFDIVLSDITTDNVTSTAHGFAPKSPADATKFLNGAATPAYAQVKDSDLSTSDITTNDVSITKHGFAPKAPNDTTKFLRGDATWSVLPSSSNPDVQVFTTTGANTWNKPSGRTTGMAILIGGGGGGGSGRMGASSTVRCGGAGGGGGGAQVVTFPLSLASATETATVGAGGTGGAAQTVNSTDGNVGNNGGNSTFTLGGSVFVTAGGGTGGVFGSTATTSAGGSGGAGGFPGATGSGGVAGAAATVASQPIGIAPGGGGGASGASASNIAGIGCDGGPSAMGRAGGVVGGSAGASVGGEYAGGSGGGGNSTLGANNGGNGGLYGAGGGGGTGATNGSASSGAGGNGANGLVVVICW